MRCIGSAFISGPSGRHRSALAFGELRSTLRYAIRVYHYPLQPLLMCMKLIPMAHGDRLSQRSPNRAWRTCFSVTPSEFLAQSIRYWSCHVTMAYRASSRSKSRTPWKATLGLNTR
jgi:hypothetical protein